MTTPWDHDSKNLNPTDQCSPLVQRKKLQLKPRSQTALEVPRSPRGRSRSISSKGDPFGAAVPREQVLKQRGIDVAKEDYRFECKAEVAHFNREQEAEIERVRAELTKLEKELRQANEMELPEETLRAQVEPKRAELNDLLTKFAEMNTTTERPSAGNFQRMERHPERRRRSKDQEHQQRDDGEDPVFASFSSNRRRRRSHATTEEQAY